MSESPPDRPLISVVIPTYERAGLLELTLKSLSEQTITASRFEVVVVDDGSADETAEVCERLAGELPVRYLRIEKAGTSAAKNLGLFASEAELVLFYDDDDVADANLLQTHVDVHAAHPEPHVAVLGYTGWSPKLEITPVMEYVTDIGQYLFAYQGVEDGQTLDYHYFWSGRTSCKRSFLAQHGIFDQDLDALEDVEIGYRLARNGLKIVHSRQARSYMVRPLTFEQFCRRCVKHGRGVWSFHSRHPEPAVERYCRIEESFDKWPALSVSLEEKRQRVDELERAAMDGGGGEEVIAELHELYGEVFDALRIQGIVEAAAEANGGHPSARGMPGDRVGSGASKPGAARDTSPLPTICPSPIFIIGSPRSGTSIGAWSLAQHSELCTEPESDLFYYLLEDGRLERAFERAVDRPDTSWLGNHAVTRERYLAHVGLGLNALFTATTGGRRWVDQTPANTLVVDRLAEMFPEARFLHILRDGRRVVHSMIHFEQVFDDDETLEQVREAGRLPPWATDFRDACQTWSRFAALASDFCRRHPDRALTVTNEKMTTDPEGAMRGTLEFLGVPHEPGPARFLRTRRINSSFTSGESDARPVLTEPWLEWLPEQREVFAREAGPMMIACGLATAEELEPAQARSGE